jgi:hypothetical protein
MHEIGIGIIPNDAVCNRDLNIRVEESHIRNRIGCLADIRSDRDAAN